MQEGRGEPGAGARLGGVGFARTVEEKGRASDGTWESYRTAPACLGSLAAGPRRGTHSAA